MGDYIVQAFYHDGTLTHEEILYDVTEENAIAKAKALRVDPTVEGDSSRVLTLDNEWVWP